MRAKPRPWSPRELIRASLVAMIPQNLTFRDAAEAYLVEASAALSERQEQAQSGARASRPLRSTRLPACP